MQQTSTTSKTSSSASTNPTAPRQSYSPLSQIEPSQVAKLGKLCSNKEVWDQLELLLGTVRQDQLELLVDPSSSTEDTAAARAVAIFISDFLTLVRNNILSRHEAEKQAADGTPPGDPNLYMEVSADL